MPSQGAAQADLALGKMNMPYNNYKTELCKFYENASQCKFGKNCTYAHSNDELRKPHEELPVGASLKQANVANMALS